MADLADVRRIALALPEVTERPSHGTPGFRVRDRLFLRVWDDDETLVTWCADEAVKLGLIAEEPEVYFTTAHYDGHAAVLVRLSAIATDELDEIIADAWRARAPKRLRADQEASP